MSRDSMLTLPRVPSPDVVARRVAGEYLLVQVFKGAATQTAGILAEVA